MTHRATAATSRRPGHSRPGLRVQLRDLWRDLTAAGDGLVQLLWPEGRGRPAHQRLIPVPVTDRRRYGRAGDHTERPVNIDSWVCSAARRLGEPSPNQPWSPPRRPLRSDESGCG